MSDGKGLDFSGFKFEAEPRPGWKLQQLSTPREAFTRIFQKRQTGSFLWLGVFSQRQLDGIRDAGKASCVNDSFHRKRRQADIFLVHFTCHTPDAVHP